MSRFVLRRRVLADHLLTGGLEAEDVAGEVGGGGEVADSDGDEADVEEEEHTESLMTAQGAEV